jgi:glucokinase
MLSRGGVYLAGGIAPQILPKLSDGSFLRSFVNKGRFSDFLRTIPVHVVMNRKVGLLGATSIARQVLARPHQ